MIRELRSQVCNLRDRLSAAHAYIVRITGRPLPAELQGSGIGATMAGTLGVQDIPNIDTASDSLVNPSLLLSAELQVSATSASSTIACPVPRRPPQPPPARSARGATPPHAKKSHPPQNEVQVVGGVAASGIAEAPHVSADEVSAEDAREVQEKENEGPGDGWSRLPKQYLASRLCEAVSALRDAASENINLRREFEALQVERDGLRQKAESLERELEERDLIGSSLEQEGFDAELARALGGGNSRLPLRDISQTSALAGMHAALFFDVLALRRQQQQLQLSCDISSQAEAAASAAPGGGGKESGRRSSGSQPNHRVPQQVQLRPSVRSAT